MRHCYVNRGPGGVVTHSYITELEEDDPCVLEVMAAHEAHGKGAWLKAQEECRPGDRVGAAGEVLERVQPPGLQRKD